MYNETKIVNAAPSVKSSDKTARIVARVCVYVALIIYAIFVVAPFVTIIITSFTPHIQLEATIGFVWKPNPLTAEAYKSVFTKDTSLIFYGYSSIAKGFINSLWQTCVPLIIGTLVSALAAYAYSKLNVPGKGKLFAIEIGTMMIPLGAFQIVEMIFYSKLGWINTVLPIIVPGMFGSAAGIFFFRSFFDSLNNEIIEAAKIDGSGVVRNFFTIILPLSIPAFMAQFILGFVGGYNDYVKPMLYLTGSHNLIPIQLAIKNLQDAFKSNQEIQCAAAIIGMLPLVVVFLACRRFFLDGIAIGSGRD